MAQPVAHDTRPPPGDEASGPLAALGIGVFRSLWIAQLVSNIGTWMQSVAAQWVLVDGRGAAMLTSLVQAASLLPVLALSLPGGVLSDALSRRRYLIALQSFMTAVTAALAVLQWAHAAGAAVLLATTFASGCATALAGPAWQAIQPELVPRRLLPPALALNGANVNVARAIGPALAGVLLSWVGPAAVFAINAATTLFVVVALTAWREPAARSASVSMTQAIRAGLRYVRAAPVVRRILLRSALFVIPGSALWSLLAVTSHSLLHLGSAGYGIGLAALGLGAVVGAVIGPKVCARAPLSPLLAAASIAFATGTGAAGLIRVAWIVWLMLILAGVGWITVLTVLQTGLQLSLPAWVRARASAMYILVFMGGQGVGSVVWGTVASALSLPTTLTLAAGLLLAGAITVLWWPLQRDTGRMDRTPTPLQPPALPAQPHPDVGPIRVEVTYRVPADNLQAFLAQSHNVALSRHRTGAHRWAMWRDLAHPDHVIEEFILDTWGEYLDDLAERITAFDSQLIGALAALAEGKPTVAWYLKAGIDPAGGDP
ncbi:MAG: MFS transporter [Bifidobacteriaceae bacterium]|nr:MFS transporter [Bifidobacteriaceae bacterium]